MKKTKRVFMLALAVLMSASAMCACSKDEGTDNSDESLETSATLEVPVGGSRGEDFQYVLCNAYG